MLNDLSSLVQTAEQDQHIAALRSAAALIATYYSALLERGIPRDVAGDLIIDLQMLWFTPREVEG